LKRASRRAEIPLWVAKRIPTRMQSFSRAVAAATAGLKSSDVGCQRKVAEEAMGSRALAMLALVNNDTAAAQCPPSGRILEA
jgi:hypothetical protein